MTTMERITLTLFIGLVVCATLAASLVMLHVDNAYSVPGWAMVTPAILPALLVACLRLGPCLRNHFKRRRHDDRRGVAA